jgi:co-chaperonin GroES (HSP10)|tara:strand:- start:721 stop:981 length:261 start_codon:yes stop_codon:yes gene_type:complete
MKAIGKYIVIKEIKDKNTTTASGLMLTENDREDIRYREGSVVKIGTDVVGVSDGDSIYYDRHAGFGIELEKEQYKVIKEQDVVIVL